MLEVHYGPYVISDDKSRVDIDVIIAYLQRSYWANNRSTTRIKQSLEASISFGVYHDDKQVGYARVVTDGATVYYICDVFILEEHRGHGLGKKLIKTIVEAEQFEWMGGILGTRDAHGLYEQYGFVTDTGRMMRRPPQARSNE